MDNLYTLFAFLTLQIGLGPGRGKKWLGADVCNTILFMMNANQGSVKPNYRYWTEVAIGLLKIPGFCGRPSDPVFLLCGYISTHEHSPNVQTTASL